MRINGWPYPEAAEYFQPLLLVVLTTYKCTCIAQFNTIEGGLKIFSAACNVES